jgi:glycosyltransferase involved in cell wall biosynthesis
MKPRRTLFYFFPLASIGGTESVHLDILKALKDYPSATYIRYRSNVWRGQQYASSPIGMKEGEAMMHDFSKYSKTKFLSSYLEAPRFGRFIRNVYVKRLAQKINKSLNPVVIFWHRESIAFLWPYLEKHVKVIDIVHNNSNNEHADATYLVHDWVPRIDKRVLVSEGLKRWLTPLYMDSNYPDEFVNRISVIPHAVNFPTDGFITKPTNALNVTFVGRDAIEKRFALFLEIVEESESRKLPIHFHIVGPNPQDYLQLKSKHVTWYGEVSDRNQIEEVYRQTHVLLLTSSSEGFPKVIAESMAFSCVPICTSVGGIPEELTHHENALLTTAENCVAQSIVHLDYLSKDNERYHHLSKNAYFYASKHFAPKRFEHDWQQILSSLG